eukprot:CAMPEP_0183346018 /NCGR_PEP_ID=MMETSP0164_2-20130417/11259_1 /TAXON_ID=221442 /ORGANISM="Coccolithus pelagicus ssp braarudi, Strain PLY182g" /LENGTH=549 /DNA_ID=CAMNT_0025517233 /DNA_START=55 /DNA_END=1701 /DNA_ORIENTATION=+
MSLTGVKRPLTDLSMSGAAGLKEIVNSYSKSKISQIIGPGGDTIKDLRARTGCRISINNECIAGMQSVSFKGSEVQLAAAVGMVNEIMASDSAAAAGGPGSHASSGGGGGGGVRLMYSPDEIAKLIGPQGTVIKTLRDETGARISIANEKQPGTNLQTITITGPDEKVALASARIAQIVGAGTPAGSHPPPSASGFSSVGGTLSAAAAPSLPEVQHMIPTEYASKLIGPGGSTIRTLRTQTAAKISIKNEVHGTPGSQYQVLSIGGTDAQTQLAMTLINQILASVEAPKAAGSAAAGTAGNDSTYNVSKDVATQLIGPSGGTIKQLRVASGAKVQVDNTLHGDPGQQYQLLTLGGTEAQVALANALINEMLTSPLGTEAIATLNPNVKAGSALSASGGEYIFTLSSNAAGKLIGPKGATIKRVREASGAKITVDNEVQAGTQEQKVTLRGGEMQVQAAYTMINEIAATADAGGYAACSSSAPLPGTSTSAGAFAPCYGSAPPSIGMGNMLGMGMPMTPLDFNVQGGGLLPPSMMPPPATMPPLFSPVGG